MPGGMFRKGSVHFCDAVAPWSETKNKRGTASKSRSKSLEVVDIDFPESPEPARLHNSAPGRSLKSGGGGVE